MKMQINGIQQLGVGVVNVNEAFAWYRRYFGMDIKIFEEAAMAELMLPHTGGEPRSRHAILALNMQGGGGFEIWQHTMRIPKMPHFDWQLGDLGICIGKLKTTNIRKAYQYCIEHKIDILSEECFNPAGTTHFFVKDPYGNTWEIVQDNFLMFKSGSITGGVFGTVIGVKNMAESMVVYRDLLGYDEVVYDKQGVFEDWATLPGGNKVLRRVLLRHSTLRNGAFSPMLGPTTIELVQAVDDSGKLIYEDRIWGDPGFIHLCFDVNGMDDLRETAGRLGFPFTVDSARSMKSFDMGEAAGSFAYIQAPEGTLIEFVETHKIPLVKKIGWYLNIDKHGSKPLSRWIFRLFGVMRVK